MKDVKRITDIPGVEDYLNNVFTFLCYDKGDDSVIYQFTLPGRVRKTITIDLSKPEYKYIMGIELLIDIISDQTIEYLSWTEKVFGLQEDQITTYHYRPLVPENEKDYL